MTETLEDRVRRAVQEDIAIEPYSPEWPRLFLEEKEHLLTCLPSELIGRIEHFGSTAVPGLAAKPIIDMLVEVASLRDPAQDCAHPGIAGIRLLLEANLGQ
ncbi:GrpB family protein [Methanothrix soehngenii]|uniref:GrpB family protein n=1 Tax=Methanothrix soehngenii TaxID=2223 RepID=UPI00300CB2B0